jgi:uncharacterized membrane protein YbaN (DUF454 family)
MPLTMIRGSTPFSSESSSPLETIKKVGLLILGWLFIFLGILGLFLPFLQGVLFILIGLAILSSRSETVKQFLKHLEKRYPHLHERVEKWETKIRGWIKKD